MNERWDLDPIYKGFGDAAFGRDVQALEGAVKELEAFAGNLTGEPLDLLKRGLALQERITELARKLFTFAELRQAADTTDAEAGSQLGRIMGIYSESAAPGAAFEGWYARLPELERMIDGDEFLSGYRFRLLRCREASRHLLPGIGERVMAKLKISGGSAWAELQQYLTSTVKVNYRGEEITLSAARNLAYSPEADVRRDAYQAELCSYAAIADPVAYALNSLKLETLNECALRSYESPLAMTLEHSDMRRATLDALFAAIDESLPQFRRYLRAKGRALGHENGLPWYDLFAPMGRSSTRFTTGQARDDLVELFSHFDKELIAMVAEAFDNAWIDFFPRSGKAGGAFCAEVPSIGQSRILTNFDGSLSDVVTLAHELGHAGHFRACNSAQSIFDTDVSSYFVEAPSTMNELLMAHYLLQSNDDKRFRRWVLSCQISNTYYHNFVTHLMEAAYQREVYRIIDNGGSVQADTLSSIMKKTLQDFWGEDVEICDGAELTWMRQPHYYMGLYSYTYSAGLTVATQVCKRIEKEGQTAVDDWKKVLAAGSTLTPVELAALAKVDITTDAPLLDTIETIGSMIDEICRLTDELEKEEK